jgi:hypothetical protein
MSRLAMFAAAIGLLLAVPAEAHPGGLNAQGCHNDRKNGGYHCHRAPSASASAPIQSLRDGRQSQRTFVKHFANCDEVRAAGAAPIRRGDLGYGYHLDRDGDGVACE